MSTGTDYSVEDFVRFSFEHAGLDWHEYVVIDPAFVRPAEVDLLIGDPSHATAKLGWTPKTSFRGLVELMVDADLTKLTRLKAEGRI